MSRQRYIKGRLFLSLALILLGANACEITPQNFDESSPIVQRGVEIKLQQLRDKKAAECKVKSLETAIFRIDSLMASDAYRIKIDTLKRPGRVVKPVKPLFKTVPDTIEVKPIIEAQDN